MEWIKVTRTLRGPKLTWVSRVLDMNRVPYRLNGVSMEAPWVEVPKESEKRAQIFLYPINSLTWNDPLFLANPGTGNYAWWAQAPKRFSELCGALGVLANRFLRDMANQVQCIPEGESTYECPYSTGLIETCPKNLWALCEPMTRCQIVFLGIAQVLDGEDSGSIRWVRQLSDQIKSRQLKSEFMSMSLFHVLGGWLTNGKAPVLVSLANRGPEAVVEALMEDMELINGEYLPKQRHHPVVLPNLSD